MGKTTIFDVAEYFLGLSSPGSSKGITHLKLQKLVFYAQALSFSINDKKLFEEDFEAWVHGPVSPDLYYAYKKNGSREIDNNVEKPSIEVNDTKIINLTWRMYGDKDGKFLENKTHNEEPWQKARQNLSYYDHSNNVITKESIRKFYSQKFIITKSKKAL